MMGVAYCVYLDTDGCGRHLQQQQHGPVLRLKLVKLEPSNALLISLAPPKFPISMVTNW